MGFWTKILIGTVITISVLLFLFAYRTNLIANKNGITVNNTVTQTNGTAIATTTFLGLHNFFFYLIFLILAIIVGLLIYWMWGLKKEDKSYKVFEEKETVSMAKAQELISKKFADFGCPVTTEETGFWIFKKKNWMTRGIEFLSQRFFSFKNQPVGLFEVNVILGQHAGKIWTLQVPLNKGEKAIYPDWNVQMTDENRFGYKLEKNNYPLLPPMSQAERTLEELYKISEGDPEKLTEIKEILELSKEMPQSVTPQSEAVPESFSQNWRTQNKQPQYKRYGRYNYPMPLSEEGEET